MPKANPSLERSASANSSRIRLAVTSQNGSKYFFTITRNSKMKKLMNAYSNQTCLDYGTFRFLFNGNHCDPNKTPEEIGLEDGDEIEAFFEMGGGGRKRTT